MIMKYTSSYILCVAVLATQEKFLQWRNSIGEAQTTRLDCPALRELANNLLQERRFHTYYHSLFQELPSITQSTKIFFPPLN